jgi:phosphoserine phosphatase RsbU/P
LTTETVKFQRKELELKALLEITQALNENKPASVLLNIFKFTCLLHLNIKSLLLYIANEEGFEEKISHGIKSKVPKVISKESVAYSKDSGELNVEVTSEYSFQELESYLPVYHKEKLLAILFLKKKEENLDLDLNFTQALTNILVVALENKRFAKSQLEQERLNKEIEIASNVQRMLFPNQLPADNRIQAKVTYYPHSTVGGDYYDFIEKTEDEVFFCIADVSGKGMPAALLMSNFQAALRTLLRTFSDLKVIVEQLNYTLFDNTKGERFITFFLGSYHFKNRTLTFINAGHNPPILCWEGEGRSETLAAGTTILGAFKDLPFIETGERKHLKGFTLHLYTDGLTECFNQDGEEYGEERLLKFVKKHLSVSPEVFHQEFLKDLDAFNNSSERNDDVTLLSLRFS